MKWMLYSAVILGLVLSRGAEAQSPVSEALSKIDPATGKATDTVREFKLSGIVGARLVMGDGRVVAFVLNPGEPALMVVTDMKGAEALIPRNEVVLGGKLGDGPFGAALHLAIGSVSVQATNKPFGISEQRPGAFFKDASGLAGRYVQITNANFSPGKFGGDGSAVVKAADGSEVRLVIGKSATGREVPGEPVNVFGFVVKAGSEWKLVASRFLLTRGKEMQALATQRTCFTCHNPDMKVIGPAYRDVAARYKDDAEAIAKLTLQMEKGGVGKWGPVPMLPLAAVVPPADRKALAEWIMSYRWDAVLAE